MMIITVVVVVILLLPLLSVHNINSTGIIMLMDAPSTCQYSCPTALTSRGRRIAVLVSRGESGYELCRPADWIAVLTSRVDCCTDK